MAKEKGGKPQKNDKTTVDAVRTVDVLDQYTDDVSEDYVPEGFASVEKFLADMREEYQFDWDADYVNREEAVEDKKFAAGEHWDPAVLQLRTGLPCLTYNTVPIFTAMVVGDWRQNRSAVDVVPNDTGTEDIANIRGDLIRSIEMQSRADRVYDNSFESSVQCGDGAFRVAVEYAKDSVFDQDIFIRSIEDAQSVIWDRMSVDPTGKDARHVFVEDRLPRKEFDKKWPNAEPWDLNERFSGILRAGRWFDDDSVKVVEYWRLIERNKLLGLFQDGSIHELSPEKHDELIQKLGQPVKTRLSPVLYAQMHLCTGFHILAGPFEYRLNRVPVIRMSGRVVNIQNRRVRFGLVRFMKDPARLRNFWRSIAAEQLGYAPKAQWMATESAIDGREDAIRKAHLTRDPLLVFNDEAIFGQNVVQIPPPQPQTALLNESQVNTQDLKDVTGIQDAGLGMKGNETSGSAILNRQREGDIANLTYHDNGNAAILEAGDVINQLIPQIYDGTRTIRLVGSDEAIRLQKINDPMDPSSPNLATGTYDVALQTGPSYTTRRVEAARAMMEAVQVWPQLIQVAGDLVAKSQDWPGADELAERLAKTIPPQYLTPEEQKKAGGAPPIDPAQAQQAQQQMQQQIQELQQKNLLLESKHDIHQKQVTIDAYNAETQRMKALHEVNHKNVSLAADVHHNAATLSTQVAGQSQQQQLEAEKLQLQIQALQQKAQATAQQNQQGSPQSMMGT